MKIIRIDTCALCPYIDWRTEGDKTVWRCNYPAVVPTIAVISAIIPDKTVFPTWCPLEEQSE